MAIALFVRWSLLDDGMCCGVSSLAFRSGADDVAFCWHCAVILVVVVVAAIYACLSGVVSYRTFLILKKLCPIVHLS